MTIVVLFHQSHYRNFKRVYLDYVQVYLKKDFTQLITYSQFVRLQKSVLVPLCTYLNSRKGKVTGISYIDSTSIRVCHNKRIKRHRVFAGYAARGKTSMGGFYGFKLHLIVNECGEFLAFRVTRGNVDDRKPLLKLAQGLTGKLFGDKGYIAKAQREKLLQQGVELITSVRRNMKKNWISLVDKALLRKRFIIETINDQLKNISQIEHARHRSVANFMVNIIAGLVAYTHQKKKPSLNITRCSNCLLK